MGEAEKNDGKKVSLPGLRTQFSNQEITLVNCLDSNNINRNILSSDSALSLKVAF
tara:strand:+ start:93 stop:257 length:165 start_codon:yes stop_codon:yes gene_type:complete